MRRVFFFVFFLSIIFLFFFIEYFYRPLKSEIKEISVQVIYQEKTHNLKLEAYSTLGEALALIKLEDDVLVSALNLNEVLSHRDVINIPLVQEHQCISINFADASALESIPGIGPKTAQSILDYRSEFGSFQFLEDLLGIKGIGEKKLQAMRDFICL